MNDATIPVPPDQQVRQINFCIPAAEFDHIDRTVARFKGGNRTNVIRMAMKWFCECVDDQGQEFVDGFQPYLPGPVRGSGVLKNPAAPLAVVPDLR